MGDRDSTENRSHSGNPTVRHAAPLDRLAAFVIDGAVLGLFATLVFSPFQRQVQSARLTENVDQYLWAGFWGGLAVLIFGILYQILFIYFRGATPGKLAFHLRVVNIWTGQKPNLGECALRAFVWWLDAITLLPNAGVYSDPQRRPLHDRVSDSMVISIGKSYAAGPSTRERHTMRGVVVGCYALIALAIGLAIVEEVQSSRSEKDADSLLSADSGGCSDIAEAFSQWGEDHLNGETRLSVGLALFAIGDINEECLNSEVSEAFKSGDELEMAYLARAFVTSEDAELSDAYLAKACFQDDQAESCRFAKLVELWTEKKWSDASRGFHELLPQSRDFVKIWAVKHFEKTKEYGSELRVISDLWPHRVLASFLGSHRVVALWGLHRTEEARMVLASVLESTDGEKSMGLTSWACLKEMEESCTTPLPGSCRLFQKSVEQAPEVLDNELVALALVKTRECREGKSVNYDELQLLVSHEGTRKLLEALSQVRAQRFDSARKILRDLGSHESDNEILAYEARHRLVDLANQAGDLKDLNEEWVAADRQTWGWRSLGAHLLRKYQGFGSFQAALEIGKALRMQDPLDSKLNRDIVVAAFKSGDAKLAWEILRPSGAERNPASQEDSEFTKIQRSLESQFGHP